MELKNAWEKYDEDGIKKIFDFNDGKLTYRERIGTSKVIEFFSYFYC